jgi:hypothetical protein
MKAGRDKNFAPTFPILDLIFGTFYMPLRRLPANFGTGENEVPAGFWGQIWYPFRKSEPAAPDQAVVIQPHSTANDGSSSQRTDKAA